MEGFFQIAEDLDIPRKRRLEVDYRLLFYRRHQGVGQTAHAEAEQILVQPFVTEDGLHD